MSADDLTIRLIDGLVLFWVVLWLTIGTWSGITFWQLADIGDTITNSGQAIKSAGDGLVHIGSLPIIGDKAGGVGNDVVSASADIAVRGQEIKQQLHQLAWLLGLSIMFMPTTPVVGMYLPLRLARRRERADLMEALRVREDAPLLDRYLAARALKNLSFTEVRAVTAASGADLSDSDARSLADAELARLGLHRSGN